MRLVYLLNMLSSLNKDIIIIIIISIIMCHLTGLDLAVPFIPKRQNINQVTRNSCTDVFDVMLVT